MIVHDLKPGDLVWYRGKAWMYVSRPDDLCRPRHELICLTLAERGRVLPVLAGEHVRKLEPLKQWEARFVDESTVLVT